MEGMARDDKSDPEVNQEEKSYFRSTLGTSIPLYLHPLIPPFNSITHMIVKMLLTCFRSWICIYK